MVSFVRQVFPVVFSQVVLLTDGTDTVVVLPFDAVTVSAPLDQLPWESVTPFAPAVRMPEKSFVVLYRVVPPMDRSARHVSPDVFVQVVPLDAGSDTVVVLPFDAVTVSAPLDQLPWDIVTLFAPAV